jgi:site-specific recombinase XerC
MVFLSTEQVEVGPVCGCGGGVVGEVVVPQGESVTYRDHRQFQDFLSYLCLKNLSETTIDGYVRILDAVFWAVGLGAAAPSSVTTAQLRTYVAALQKRRLAPATVAKRVMVLKRFFGFLVQAGYLTTDPSRGLPRPKVGQQIARDEADVQRVQDVLGGTRF